MADPQMRLGQIIEALRSRGYRLTPQRLAMLRIIARSAGHPSVEQIYAQIRADFPTTSLATIYKTLNMLKEIGEVLELTFASVGSRYDGNRPYPHPHVICSKCGQILDSEYKVQAEVAAEMARQTGYRITHHQLNFFGLCPGCQPLGPAGRNQEEERGQR